MDNPLDQEETPNPVPHIHHYVIKGSGLSCYAECVCPLVGCSHCRHACGEKLAGDNGPIVGSRAKVESAMP